MNVEWVRELCMTFPHATEKISWGHDLTFRVNEKIFAVTVLEPAPVWLSFKCTPETFAELTERMGIIPAPYMARAKWVALEIKEALNTTELSQLLRESYDLVFAKLPKKTQRALAQGTESEKRDRTRAGPSKPTAKKKPTARRKSRDNKNKRRRNV
jgi:predicted DNA-binding protein (MmcQ/YjbR family)